MSDKRYVDRDEFISLWSNLIQDMQQKNISYDVVINIMNGWNHLTDLLLRNLSGQIDKKTTHIYNIACDAGYHWQEKKEDPILYNMPSPSLLLGKKILIIEDLIHTWWSLNSLITTLESIVDTTQIDIAVLFIKEKHHFNTDKVGNIFSAQENIDPELWIKFYYEDEN